MWVSRLGEGGGGGGGLEAEVASTEQMTVDKAWEKREREESRMWEADSHTHHTR